MPIYIYKYVTASALAIADKGTQKNIIVNICPPFSTPKMLTAKVGNIEKCAPSAKNAKKTNME